MNHRKRQRPLSWYTIYFLVLFFIPQWIFTQGVLFQNTSGDTLAYIADEGTTGSLKIKPGVAPSDMTNKLYNVGGNLHWGNLPLSHMWNKNGSHVYYNDGKVGIGEMAPTADLEVNGNDGVLFEGIYGIGTIPKEGSGTRMMWYPKKAAFRAGSTESTWDDVNIGIYSTALGLSTEASGNYAIALGGYTTADGSYSTAMGRGTTAGGENSTAMGYFTTASGPYSTAMGHSTTAGGENSITMGYFTTASGNYSTAIGINTIAGGDYSTSIGRGIEVSGNYSVGIGLNDQSSTIINQDNTMAIMGGKVGIGEIAPSGDLEVSGTDGILFEGIYGIGTIPKEGSGTRMMWYPKKAAFRAGSTESTWDDVNIGIYSTALGLSTEASGNYAIALGSYTAADGSSSTALGSYTTADGSSSTALGFATIAEGDYSTALGYNTTARGLFSLAIGREIEAAGEYSVAIALNDQNGNVVSQNNTMAIMGGKVGVGEIAPSGDLEVSGTDGILFEGTFGSGTLPTTGVGTRMMWYPKKAAFRAGYVANTEWDDINIGEYSVSMGHRTIGSGDRSTALGSFTEASGFRSTAMGHDTKASGLNSTTIGREIEAAGEYTFAIALNNQNGTVVSQDNAMVIVGGDVGIGTVSPGYLLEVNGTAGKPGGGSWSNSSDVRLKDIQGFYMRGLDDITLLQPVKFNYIKDNPRSLPSDEDYFGFIAQEVQEVFPEAVSEGKDGYLDFNMHAINVAMVNAIKELKRENDLLKEALEALKERIKKLDQ